jgi:hypothetical protein
LAPGSIWRRKEQQMIVRPGFLIGSTAAILEPLAAEEEAA